jgi:4-hydroxybenzoate polyprenyltransferase
MAQAKNRQITRGIDAVPRLPALVRAMRPLQWTKSSLVFAALLFDRKVFEAGPLIRSVAAAVVFCLLSSAIYLINDVRDVEADRVHPRKRRRPIAAGEVSERTAMTTAIALLVVGVIGAAAIRPVFSLVALGYIVLMIAYNARLKELVILDVFAIAAGFVLRAAGGAVAIAVPISPWLYVCTMLGALFIGFGKRRNEIETLEHLAVNHRANLQVYTLPLLDQIIAIISSAILMAYSLYTFDASNVPNNHAMMLTIPFVMYALFRYLYLIYQKKEGGSPEVLLITDRPMLFCIVAWGLSSGVILYLTR